MIYEKLEAIEKLAAQLQQVIADLRHENSVLKETIQQFRAKNMDLEIEISILKEQLRGSQAIGKSNIYSLTAIKQQGTEGVAHTTEMLSKPRSEEIEAEKPQKAVRKPRKPRAIDLLASPKNSLVEAYEAEAVV